MRLPPSWRLVGRARARLIGRARARVCAGCGGVGQCCCGGVAWVVEGFAYERGVSWCFGDVRQTRVMERFTRCGSNALDGEAMH